MDGRVQISSQGPHPRRRVLRKWGQQYYGLPTVAEARARAGDKSECFGYRAGGLCRTQIREKIQRKGNSNEARFINQIYAWNAKFNSSLFFIFSWFRGSWKRTRMLKTCRLSRRNWITSKRGSPFRNTVSRSLLYDSLVRTKTSYWVSQTTG